MFRNVHRKYLMTSALLLTAILAAAFIVLNVTVQHMLAGDERALLSVILRSGGDPGRLSEEGAASADYFLVRTTGAAISGMDLAQASGVSEDELQHLAQLAVGEGKESGRLGPYAYQRQLGPLGSTYAFLNVSADLLAESRLLVASIAVGAVCEALMLLVVGFIALRWVRPAEQLLEASRDIMERSAAGMDAGAAYLISAYRGRGQAQSSPALREGTVLAGIAADLRGVADAIDRPGQPQAVDVSALMAAVAAESEPLLAERDLQVRTVTEEGVLWRGRPAEIRALLEILLSGALEYAAPGGALYLDTLTDGKSAAAVIRYDVENLPQADAASLLEGASGSREGLSGGLYAAGLLARLNHGELACEYLDPPAVCFTVRFRACGRPEKHSRA